MIFMDRVTLGKKLARDLQKYRGKDAVLLCLTEDSLLTSLAMAVELRAWVYPLLYAAVYSPLVPSKLLGAYTDDGDFCLNPEMKETMISELAPEEQKAIKDQQRPASNALHVKKQSYEMTFTTSIMEGRDVIIVGDIITTSMPLSVALKMLQSVHAKSVTAVVGNATIEVATYVRLCATKTTVLDVLSGPIRDKSHYYEHTDGYTYEQQRLLTKNIATFWR